MQLKWSIHQLKGNQPTGLKKKKKKKQARHMCQSTDIYNEGEM